MPLERFAVPETSRRRGEIPELADACARDYKAVKAEIGVEDLFDFMAGWWANEVLRHRAWLNTDASRNQFEKLVLERLG